jgi:hypothetical protein
MPHIFRLPLLLALPVEAVNFWVIGYPADRHTLSATSQNAAIALQWYVIHLPGIILSDHSQFLRSHEHLCALMFLLIGFVNTAILLAVLIFAVRLALHALHKLSSPLRHAH